MAEYIEREAFYKFLTEQKGKETGAYSKGRNAGLDVARSALHNREITPAADVALVRHGRWLLEREPSGKPYCFHCSACDDDFHCIGITTAYDYCPHCGAKMDGKDGESA